MLPSPCQPLPLPDPQPPALTLCIQAMTRCPPVTCSHPSCLPSVCKAPTYPCPSMHSHPPTYSMTSCACVCAAGYGWGGHPRMGAVCSAECTAENHIPCPRRYDGHAHQCGLGRSCRTAWSTFPRSVCGCCHRPRSDLLLLLILLPPSLAVVAFAADDAATVSVSAVLQPWFACFPAAIVLCREMRERGDSHSVCLA